MKKSCFFIIICIFLFNCNAIRKKSLVHYLSTLENIKVLSPTKEESVLIDSFKLASKKFLEECEQNGGNCIDDRGNMHLDATFPKGIHNFRIVLFEKFKLPDDAKEGENLSCVTIGNKNNLEKIEILKYTDEKTKKAIEDVFRLKELNVWTSAKIYGIPVKEQFEISVFVKKKL